MNAVRGDRETDGDRTTDRDGDGDAGVCVESGGYKLTSLSNGCHYCVTLSSLPILILTRSNLYAAGFMLR